MDERDPGTGIDISIVPEFRGIEAIEGAVPLADSSADGALVTLETGTAGMVSSTRPAGSGLASTGLSRDGSRATAVAVATTVWACFSLRPRISSWIALSCPWSVASASWRREMVASCFWVADSISA